MQPWALIRNQLSIDHLLRDANSVEGTVNLLRRYLEDERTKYTQEMRQRQVRDLMAEMRERGMLLRSDPRYVILNEFYMKVFGEEFPAWVVERVSRRKIS